MRSRYVVLMRLPGGTRKSRFATLDEALDALDYESRALTTAIRPRSARALGREYEPEQLVAVRAELRGPGGLRAGIDVHGDVSAQAFTGRVNRVPIEPRDDEDAWAALRRVVRERAGPQAGRRP